MEETLFYQISKLAEQVPEAIAHTAGGLTAAGRPTFRHGGRAISEDEAQQLLGLSKADLSRCVHQHVAARETHEGRRQRSCHSSKEGRASPYPEVKGLPDAYHTFYLHHGGLPDSQRQRAIALAKEEATPLGSECNQNLQSQTDFGSYLSNLTNIGDPFKEDTSTANSKFMERAVLDYFAELWHAPFPHASDQPESYWGYCFSTGSSEGTMYGMWNARDYLAGKKILVDDSLLKAAKTKQGPSENLPTPRLVYHSPHLPSDVHNPNAFTPIAFFSEDIRHSLTKTMAMLEIRTFDAEGVANFSGMCPLPDMNGEWPAAVPCQKSGAIDVDALAQLVEFFASKGYPIIVCFNYGSTLKGAYDDVAGACDKLQSILEKYNLLERPVHYDEHDTSKQDVRTGYWFHVEGALGATQMPYIEMAHAGHLVDQRGPIFDFRLGMVHSISTNVDNWIGAAGTGGVFMTRTKYQMLPRETPEYIGTPDTVSRDVLEHIGTPDTISIPASGHSPIGAAGPGGIYMTRTKHQMLPPDMPEYIGAHDTTSQKVPEHIGIRDTISSKVLEHTDTPDTISIPASVHNPIGAAGSGGIYMTRTKHQMLPPDMPEYIGAHNTTASEVPEHIGTHNTYSSKVPEHIGTPDTISMPASVHNPIGAAGPGGIYMTRTKHQMLPPDMPEYIGTPHTTSSKVPKHKGTRDTVSIPASVDTSIGAAHPGGIYMTRTKHQMLPPDMPEYIGTPDAISNARLRNDQLPMLLWDYIARTPYEDQISKALYLEQLATYAERRLLQLQKHLQEDLFVDRAPLVLAVRFKGANDDISLKYTLPNESNGDRLYSYIFMMEHVSHELIDALVDDLSKPGAFMGKKVSSN